MDFLIVKLSCDTHTNLLSCHCPLSQKNSNAFPPTYCLLKTWSLWNAQRDFVECSYLTKLWSMNSIHFLREEKTVPLSNIFGLFQFGVHGVKFEQISWKFSLKTQFVGHPSICMSKKMLATWFYFYGVGGNTELSCASWVCHPSSTFTCLSPKHSGPWF